MLMIGLVGVATMSFPVYERYLDNRPADAGYLCYSKDCLRLGLLSDLPLTIGSLLGLLSLGAHLNSEELVECRKLLHAYARREKFGRRWLEMTRWDLGTTLLLWLAVVLERIRGAGVVQAALKNTLDGWSILHIIMFAVSTLMLNALVFCMLYIISALKNVVDDFCVTIVGERTLDGAVPRWNAVQAILRKGSKSIQLSLFAMQATMLFTFLLGVVDFMESVDGESLMDSLIPAALLTLGISRVFFKAAGITDKCARVPSLINSCNFGEDLLDDIDMERQYVVLYVLNSGAGFHVFEICLTSNMTMKFAYVSVIGMFTLATRVIANI